jgi:hypothetical protein
MATSSIRSMVRTSSALASSSLAAALLITACLTAAAPAVADHLSGRYITVNGQPLGPQEMAEADWNVGFRLPNGHYWWDPNTGYWGLVGGAALGRVAPARRSRGSGGGGGGGGLYPITIDPSGGCEGGSCVNILD